MAERRRSERLPLNLPAQLSATGTAPVTVQVLDLSVQGALVQTELPPPAGGGPIALELVVDLLSGVTEHLRLTAKMLQTRKIEPGWLCGVRFDDEATNPDLLKLDQFYLERYFEQTE
ncbi:MAG: PilZ domain-containing protein [Candidatus Lambdaproteobacteria bacterium]|nr:PilZ domain-containing protein [Candidatus Lambdaproteobacteria bacterium]